MFNKLEGDAVILQQNGVFKEADLYEWSGGLYAKASGGFVRLKADGTTTKSGVRIEHMETDRHLFRDRFNRLATRNKGNKPVSLGDDGKLLLN